MKGYEVIASLQEHVGEDDLIVSSNGNISREVYHFLQRPQVYLRGSMGLPVSVGIGLAVLNPQKHVTVITGDGNLLMSFGSIVTAAHYKPRNLRILILDNSQYFTTGGQETVSSTINYSKFLDSMNINNFQSQIATMTNINRLLADFFGTKQMAVLHLVIEEGKKELVNIPWHPMEIAQKFLVRFNKKKEGKF